MNDIITQTTTSIAAPLPEPKTNIAVRLATATDLAFIDALQKEHSKMVGWMPTKQLETNISKGKVLVAEEVSPQVSEIRERLACSGLTADRCSLPSGRPVGYCISTDRYLKHDDLGIVYQLNVLPTQHRGLIGATLVKEVFERAAYGCKLFCCWCAQDLEANHFWESIGFVPLAFRAGSRGKAQGGNRAEGRIHIFWQRRIREGDSETPYWFPSETSGGALRENRIVLPIPPGTHWSDAKPMVLPGLPVNGDAHALPEGEQDKPKRKPRQKKVKEPAIKRSAIARGGLRFTPGQAPPPPVKAKKTKAKRVRQKNDPKYVAAARELRDRYMDEINDGLLLPPSASGKYDVSRQLEAAPSAMNEVSGGPIGELVDGNGGDGRKLLDAA